MPPRDMEDETRVLDIEEDEARDLDIRMRCNMAFAHLHWCHCQEEATDAIGLRVTPPTPKYERSTFSLTRMKIASDSHQRGLPVNS